MTEVQKDEVWIATMNVDEGDKLAVFQSRQQGLDWLAEEAVRACDGNDDLQMQARSYMGMPRLEWFFDSKTEVTENDYIWDNGVDVAKLMKREVL